MHFRTEILSQLTFRYVGSTREVIGDYTDARLSPDVWVPPAEGTKARGEAAVLF